MTMNKASASRLAPAIFVALLVTACGLKGDLYIPSEATAVTPADVQSADDENAEGDEESGQSSEQAP